MKQRFLVWLYILLSSTLMLAIDNAVNSCYLLITHNINSRDLNHFPDNKLVIYFNLKMSWLLFPQKQQLLWLHVKRKGSITSDCRNFKRLMCYVEHEVTGLIF